MRVKPRVRWLMGTAFMLFAVAGLFIAGHPTVIEPYNRFNEKGSGWRAIYASGDCLKAAGEIEIYFRFHPELSATDRTILHFHAAQMFAYAGVISRAMSHLNQGTNSFMSPEWNDMVNATRAFLLSDREQLNAARERMVTDHAPDETIREADRLIAHFGESYDEMRHGTKRPPMKVHESRAK